MNDRIACKRVCLAQFHLVTLLHVSGKGLYVGKVLTTYLAFVYFHLMVLHVHFEVQVTEHFIAERTIYLHALYNVQSFRIF